MKRIRIWLSNFSLMQQFLAIVFLNCALLIFFIFSLLNKNIDTFVNNQMFSYIHSQQREFLISREFAEDSNVVNFIYNTSNQRYLNSISNEYQPILNRINPNVNFDAVTLDASFEYEDISIVYSILPFDKDFRLISIVKNSYRDEFRGALVSGVVNVTFYVVAALIAIVMIWVVTLIRPLNQIKNYINKLRAGEKAELYLGRNDEIGEVGEALVTMNKELSEQQHIRDEMIQNISHDLKTPIATIKSYSESIKDGIYPYETLEKSVDVISDNANRLEKKVYSLITYNKLGYLVDTDKGILNLQMSDIIEKALMGVQVLRNDVDIKTDVDESVYFHGEEEPWRVVIENLLDNALRYAKSEVNINLRKNMLEVSNDGPTMSADRIDKLFKPYEKGTGGIFGLGMSIVKRVCDTYGYTVTGENTANGVVFRIYTLNKYKKAPKKSNKKGIIK